MSISKSDSEPALEKTVLQRKIEAIDQQLDHVVYELYGLTDEDIRIIEK